MDLLRRAGPDTRASGYILVAWLIAFLPSLALFAVRVATGSATLALPLRPGVAAFAAYSILVAPLLETAVLFALAAVLRRWLAPRPLAAILTLASLGAAAHALNGTAWAVAAAFWPFAVYAACLLAWWPRSARDAFVVAAAVHALYNAAFLAVGLGAGLLASDPAIRP